MDREEYFYKIATEEVDLGMAKLNEIGSKSNDTKIKVGNDERNISTKASLSNTISELAVVSEHFLKAPVIYEDLKKCGDIKGNVNDQFSRINMLNEISNKLKRPESIQNQAIKKDDVRKNKVLTLDNNSRIKGHDLYAYYQLQNSTNLSLINHEVLTRDGNELFNWIEYGILTQDDIFKIEDSQHIYLSDSFQEKLWNNRISYEIYRYSTDEEIKDIKEYQDSYNFFNQFSCGLRNITWVLYPEYEKYKIMSAITEKGSRRLENLSDKLKKIINSLSIVNKYFLLNNFSEKEFEFLIYKLDWIRNNSTLSDRNDMAKLFTNFAVYLKTKSVKEGADIVFDNKVFDRIFLYSQSISKEDTFKKDSKQFKNTKYFMNNEDKLKKSFDNSKHKKQTNDVISEDYETNKVLSFEEKIQELYHYLRKSSRLPNINDKIKFSDGICMYNWIASQTKVICQEWKKINSNHENSKMKTILNTVFSFILIDEYLNSDESLSTIAEKYDMNKEQLYRILMTPIVSIKPKEYIENINSLEELKNVENVLNESSSNKEYEIKLLEERIAGLKQDAEELSKIERETKLKTLEITIAKEYDSGAHIKELAKKYHLSQKTISDLISNYSERYKQNHIPRLIIPNDTIMGYEIVKNYFIIYKKDGNTYDIPIDKDSDINVLKLATLNGAFKQIRMILDKTKNIHLMEEDKFYIKRWKKDLIPYLDKIDTMPNKSILDFELFDLYKINTLGKEPYEKYIETVKTELNNAKNKLQ